MEEEFRYTVLAYEDGRGLWLKIPELDQQCCTDDLESGLDALDEDLAARRSVARGRGEQLWESLDREVRWVDKEGYGPTLVDIERARHERESLEEERDEAERG